MSKAVTKETRLRRARKHECMKKRGVKNRPGQLLQLSGEAYLSKASQEQAPTETVLVPGEKPLKGQHSRHQIKSNLMGRVQFPGDDGLPRVVF